MTNLQLNLQEFYENGFHWNEFLDYYNIDVEGGVPRWSDIVEVIKTVYKGFLASENGCTFQFQTLEDKISFILRWG